MDGSASDRLMRIALFLVPLLSCFAIPAKAWTVAEMPAVEDSAIPLRDSSHRVVLDEIVRGGFLHLAAMTASQAHLDAADESSRVIAANETGTKEIGTQETVVGDSPARIPVFGVVTAPMPITSFGVEGVDGAMVTAVAPQSAGALAGIRVGDILLRIDGKAVNEPDDVTTTVARVPSGTAVAVRLMRKARPVWVSVQF